MFHHIKRSSSTLKASTLEFLHQFKTQVLYPSFLEESKKPGGPLEISLRPVELTDVDDIMLWATDDDELSRYCEWSTGIYTSKEDALEDIKNIIIPHSWFRAICLKNRSIGKIYVDPNHKGNPCFGELGYAVASKHWGKGIATTAVKMALDSVFKECPHLKRLDARVNIENLGSLRVLEKAGFRKKRVIKERYIHKGKSIDKAVYRFLSTDFKRLD